MEVTQFSKCVTAYSELCDTGALTPEIHSNK